MNPLPCIRQLYQPVQPATDPGTPGVQYRETQPHPALRDLVYCYWELKTTTPLSAPFSYRVVADGCTDIFTDLYHPEQSSIMGFCDRYTAFPLDNTFHYSGIRFLPGMFTLLTGISADTLSNRSEALEAVWPATAAFISNRLHHGLDPASRAALQDEHLLQLLAAMPPRNYDHRFYEAMALLLQHSGNISMGSDLAIGISPRQLRRLFHHYIGDSAKAFGNVVRFQRLLQTCTPANITKQKTYFDLGYYDQAHFTRSFRQFYGLTPGQAAGT